MGPRGALPAARLRRCALRARLRAGGAAPAPPRDVTLAAEPPGAAAAPGALGPRPRPACRPRGGKLRGRPRRTFRGQVRAHGAQSRPPAGSAAPSRPGAWGGGWEPARDASTPWGRLRGGAGSGGPTAAVPPSAGVPTHCPEAETEPRTGRQREAESASRLTSGERALALGLLGEAAGRKVATAEPYPHAYPVLWKSFSPCCNLAGQPPPGAQEGL